MQALALRMPPAALTVLTAFGMWATAEAFPTLDVPLPPLWRAGIGVLLVAVGIGVALAGVGEFRRAATTVNPFSPEASAHLVTGGVYRYSRNPMYLGMLLGLAGWAVALAHLTAPLWLMLYAAYMNRFQIAPEERALAERFGPVFADYRRRVRRWL
jgi:protein-S-isoprenylcysteine O-methyltransferase Ste14